MTTEVIHVVDGMDTSPTNAQAIEKLPNIGLQPTPAGVIMSRRV